MLNKKLIIFSIFLVGMLAIGAVNAVDNTTDMIGGEPSTDLASQDTDDVLTADKQTFTQLNQAINENNNNTEINLTSDYIYSDDDDDSFREGIVIDRNITINGNGHTINGDGEARIFRVTGGNVVFYNITFTKGYCDGDGGAICGKCKAINCTFKENKVDHGYGGAMYDGSAINCIFTGNAADAGGGAMREGSAVNCTFKENRAFQGGAMFGGSARDCTFSGNVAEDMGGAMISGSAVNCTFSGNIVKYEGGAMHSNFAVNCSFSGNSALSGVDMCRGYKLNCINLGGDDYYFRTGELILQFNAYDSTFVHNSVAILPIELISQYHDSIPFINYDVVVYKNDVIVRTYHCLSNEELSLDLDVGNYTAELKITYPNINPNPKNITLTVLKETPNIEVSASDVTYPDNVIVNVKSDIAGEYTVKVGEKSQTVNLEAGVARNVTFTRLAANEEGHIVNVTHDSENYTGFNDTVKVVVHKATANIDVSTNDVTYPDNVVVNVKSDVSGNYTVKVGDKTQNVDLVAGVAKNVNFIGLAANENDYPINVTFNGNENYTAVFNDAKTVKVKKATPSLTASAKSFKFEDKTKKYVVTLKDSKGNAIKNTKVTLKVNGITYTATTNGNGVATFALTKLTKTGNAVISYPGDKNHNKISKTVKLTVNTPVFKTVSYGSKDKTTVKKIQIALKKHGFYLKAHGHYLKVDGIFHKYTVLAVKQFQKANKLKVTGAVDYKTAKKLKIVK